MAYQSRVLGAINVTKTAKQTAGEQTGDLSDLMANPDYLRHSSAIIHDSLKQGFDVLQLPNGDIVTTGTKVIVTTYSWDAGRAKLAKRTTTPKEPSKRGRKKQAEEA